MHFRWNIIANKQKYIRITFISIERHASLVYKKSPRRRITLQRNSDSLSFKVKTDEVDKKKVSFVILPKIN